MNAPLSADFDLPGDRRGAPAHWCEQWSFDAVFPDPDDGGVMLGVAVSVGRRPATGRGWYHAVVVGPGRATVFVIDTDLVLGGGAGGLELRSPGLWADHNASAALGHWTVAAEAFGVALDDPWDAWGRAFGTPQPVGLDLEWDPVGAPDGPADGSADDAGSWWVGCEVHGVVLVGDERHEVTGYGTRGRSWGPAVPVAEGHRRVWWCDGAGRWRHAAGAAPIGADGVAPLVPPVRSVTAWAPVLGAGDQRLIQALVACDDGESAGAGWLVQR